MNAETWKPFPHGYIPAYSVRVTVTKHLRLDDNWIREIYSSHFYPGSLKLRHPQFRFLLHRWCCCLHLEMMERTKSWFDQSRNPIHEGCSLRPYHSLKGLPVGIRISLQEFEEDHNKHEPTHHINYHCSRQTGPRWNKQYSSLNTMGSLWDHIRICREI